MSESNETHVPATPDAADPAPVARFRETITPAIGTNVDGHEQQAVAAQALVEAPDASLAIPSTDEAR